jgi:hypothetical protein
MTPCPHGVRTSARPGQNRRKRLFESAASLLVTAESVGFEPTVMRNTTAVFKTAALGH